MLVELELQVDAWTSEVHLGDHSLTTGETVTIAGRLWRVARKVPAEGPLAEARYVCVRAHLSTPSS